MQRGQGYERRIPGLCNLFLCTNPKQKREPKEKRVISPEQQTKKGLIEEKKAGRANTTVWWFKKKVNGEKSFPKDEPRNSVWHRWGWEGREGVKEVRTSARAFFVLFMGKENGKKSSKPRKRTDRRV